MLCLADRGFFGYDLWKQALETGCELLWRAKSNYGIETVAELADGSYLANVYHHQDRRRIKPLQLRVIEYTIDESVAEENQDGFYRLFTSILDPDAAPASELAACIRSAGRSSLSLTSSRPISTIHAGYCDHNLQSWPIRRSGGCSGCIMRFGR